MAQFDPNPTTPLTPEQRVTALEAFLDGRPLAVAKLELDGTEVMTTVRRMDGSFGDYDVQCTSSNVSGHFRLSPAGERIAHDSLSFASSEIKNLDVVLRALKPELRYSDGDAFFNTALHDEIDSQFRADPDGVLEAAFDAFKGLQRPEVHELEPHFIAEIALLIEPLVIETVEDASVIADGEYISIQLVCTPTTEQITIFLTMLEERELERAGKETFDAPVLNHAELPIALEEVATGKIIHPARADFMIEFPGLKPATEYRPILLDE